MIPSYSYFEIISPICSFDETKWIGKLNRGKLILFYLLLFASICFIDSAGAQDGKM